MRTTLGVPTPKPVPGTVQRVEEAKSSRSPCVPPSSDSRLLPLFAGEIFLETAPDKFTLEEAAARCRALGAELARTGQLYAAWNAGLDACSPGWLADGSVRYPIVTPRERCGGALPGVKTIFLFRNQTGFPDAQSRYDAYCFRGKDGHPPACRCSQTGTNTRVWSAPGQGAGAWCVRGDGSSTPTHRALGAADLGCPVGSGSLRAVHYDMAIEQGCFAPSQLCTSTCGGRIGTPCMVSVLHADISR